MAEDVPKPEPKRREESDDDGWSSWLSPEQAKLLQDEISSHARALSTLNTQLEQRANSLSISQKMVDGLKAANARLSQQLFERGKE